jgi:hypothetical protein
MNRLERSTLTGVVGAGVAPALAGAETGWALAGAGTADFAGEAAGAAVAFAGDAGIAVLAEVGAALADSGFEGAASFGADAPQAAAGLLCTRTERE